MQRVGFCFNVKEDAIAQYVEWHRKVWPEMLEALRDAGWRNYSLFTREDGLVFGYLETDDFDQALAGMAEREVNARWQALMAPYFQIDPGKRPDQSMERLTEVSL